MTLSDLELLARAAFPKAKVDVLEEHDGVHVRVVAGEIVMRHAFTYEAVKILSDDDLARELVESGKAWKAELQKAIEALEC